MIAILRVARLGMVRIVKTGVLGCYFRRQILMLTTPTHAVTVVVKL